MIERRFILASSSQSRVELLKIIGFEPYKIISTNIDETPLKREKPKDLSMRLAREKMDAAILMLDDEDKKNTVVLTADTVIAVGTRVVDKALTDADVESSMRLISGRNNMCYSSFCIICFDENGEKVLHKTKLSTARVKVKNLSIEDIREMVESKQGIGKAGGYALEGLFASYITRLSGSSTAVKGLCLYKVRSYLKTLKVAKLKQKGS